MALADFANTVGLEEDAGRELRGGLWFCSLLLCGWQKGKGLFTPTLDRRHPACGARVSFLVVGRWGALCPGGVSFTFPFPHSPSLRLGWAQPAGPFPPTAPSRDPGLRVWEKGVSLWLARWSPWCAQESPGELVDGTVSCILFLFVKSLGLESTHATPLLVLGACLGTWLFCTHRQHP